MTISTPDLFAVPTGEIEPIAEGVVLLRGFVLAEAATLVREIHRIAEAAPFRHMVTLGGHTMSAAMTNCGLAGWTTDRSGYRYACVDPTTRVVWPALPDIFSSLAGQAATRAGFRDFRPDACLVNRYAPGAKLSLHQDRDELDFDAPIVSVSLGLSATFLFGGPKRAERPRRIALEHGDVVVWGGPARLSHHGVAPVEDGVHEVTGRVRYNLTLRKAL